jgi:aromatic-L-amino-acid/L-tryptophan decarboxylase
MQRDEVRMAQSSAPDPACLELSVDEMRAMVAEASERVLAHLATLAEQPASGDVDAAELCRSMREPPPEHGRPLGELLGPLFEQWIPRSFNAAGPGYLAYVPGGGLFPAAIGAFVADAVNRYTGVSIAAPALVQLESNVLEWFRQWMGFPPGARGLLTTGGSMASFSAIVTARERLLGPELRRGVLYTSSEAHHCILKAARLAGILPDRVRVLAVDAERRMRVAEAEEAIVRDQRAGLRPFLLVSSAGTVNTGAIDPLEDLAELCARHGLWHHVDGAYGGFFHLCPELRGALRGLSRADSLVLDPHKGLFLPYGTGALLVRDGEALRQAHAATAGYMPAAAPDDGYDPAQYGPELSRDFRGLRVWLPLELFGVARFREALREKHRLALEAAAAIGAMAGLRVPAAPALSLFGFHVSLPGASIAEENRATRELLERVNRRQRVMLTGTQADERYLGRVCVLSFRTRRARIAACLEDVRAEAEALLAARGPATVT